MKTILCLVAVTLVALNAHVYAQDAGEWISLFDGEALTGWVQHNGKATYVVEDGAIVGTTAPNSPNSFLCSEGLYGDFELEFEVKVDRGLNSGVQIRSNLKGLGPDAGLDARKAGSGKRVNGPQVEIEWGPGQSGYIYGEAAGGWRSPEPKSKDKAVNRHDHFRNEGWNQYRVVAKGATIQTYINDRLIADLTDETIFGTHPRGFIGLQVHGVGKRTNKMQVRWRRLRIRELK